MLVNWLLKTFLIFDVNIYILKRTCAKCARKLDLSNDFRAYLYVCFEKIRENWCWKCSRWLKREPGFVTSRGLMTCTHVQRVTTDDSTPMFSLVLRSSFTRTLLYHLPWVPTVYKKTCVSFEEHLLPLCK